MEKLKIGKIVGTHALKGELKIRSFSDFNDQRFVVGHKLYLNEIVDPFIIKTVRVHKGNYLISFEGLQDINLVEKYIGYNVYGLKEDVELDDDEYFYDDLIGCQIINTSCRRPPSGPRTPDRLHRSEPSPSARRSGSGTACRSCPDRADRSAWTRR